ncbi:hypothetical protein [Actinoplanes sp. NPDC026623]|uniref:hypothetical protein n=1 Tax=Actinoplanes sp. NPDC026623 TaxID=3155610 RepID=UPI0033D67A87
MSGEAYAAESAPAFRADPRRPPRSWIFNLLIGRHHWLVLDVLVSANAVVLRTIQHIRWTDADPVVVSSESPQRGGRGRARRRRDIEMINQFERDWPPTTDADDVALRDAAFRLARKLLTPSFTELLLSGRSIGPDVAIALPGEEIASVLQRMQGRCRPESLIARPRSYLGIRSFQLLRTRPTASPS